MYFQEELCILLSEDTEEDSSVLQWFQDAKTKKDNNLTSCKIFSFPNSLYSN